MPNFARDYHRKKRNYRSGSVVTKNIPNNTVAGGVSAKVLERYESNMLVNVHE